MTEEPTRPFVTVVVLDDETADLGRRRETLRSVSEQQRCPIELRWVGVDGVGIDIAHDRFVRVDPSDSPVSRLSRALVAATGELVTVLGPGDSLLPDALAQLADILTQSDTAVLAYGDEQDRDDDEVVLRKPAWSPERLRHHNYVGRPWLARLADVHGVVEQVAPTSAWEHELLLRLTEGAGASAVNVTQTLCRRARVDPPDSADTAMVVRAHLDRRGIEAEVAPREGYDGVVTLRRPAPEELSIAVVIPTGWGTRRPEADPVGAPERDAAADAGTISPLIIEAVRDLLATTTHPSIEVVVVYDEPVPAGAFEALRDAAGDRLRLVPYDKDFNFSEKCNLGVLASEADVVVLYNDDVLPISNGWLETLVAPLRESDVGMTGAKLRFADGTIQSGGHRYYRQPTIPSPVEAFRLWPAGERDPGDLLAVNREVSGVTGACLAIRRDVFDEVGGLTEALPQNYNDVDLSLKVRRAGYRIMWLTGCEMTHLESQSRVPRVEPWERATLGERWGGFSADAYVR